MSDKTRVYKIEVPEEVPSYVSDSVQARCNQALCAAFTYETKNVESRAVQEALQELGMLRHAVDGSEAHNPWMTWGWRTVTTAWQDAARLAVFRDALNSVDFSHVTSGHQVSPDSFHVYHCDPSSPSGCILTASVGKSLQGVKEVMEGRCTCAGGERGETASRQMMRG